MFHLDKQLMMHAVIQRYCKNLMTFMRAMFTIQINPINFEKEKDLKWKK